MRSTGIRDLILRGFRSIEDRLDAIEGRLAQVQQSATESAGTVELPAPERFPPHQPDRVRHTQLATLRRLPVLRPAVDLRLAPSMHVYRCSICGMVGRNARTCGRSPDHPGVPETGWE